MKITTIFMACILIGITSAADILQNPDFELPPSNWKPDSTSTFSPLDENSTLPGWTFEGEVKYAIAGSDLPLPTNNGHAILLGQDGKINQTFAAKGEKTGYTLTFTLTMGGNNTCQSNASLVVSAPDYSAHFSLTQKYGKESWEVYGQLLGTWGDGEEINLILQSEAIDTDENSTCWPVVDDLLLATTVGSLTQPKDNLLLNGGFEYGPSFPESTNGRILLDSEPSLTESILNEWTIMGTVKYINSKSYSVPQGEAAVELVSGVSSGVQTSKQLSKGSNYDLEFMLGDANDSCIGDFTVGVIAGSSGQNFSIHSNGTGSSEKHLYKFKGEGSSQTISFQSYTATQREDGVFCGPVIDGVVLRNFSRCSTSANSGFLIAVILAALLKMSQLV